MLATQEIQLVHTPPKESYAKRVKKLESTVSRLSIKYPEVLVINDDPQRPHGNNHYGENYYLLFDEYCKQKAEEKNAKKALPIAQGYSHLKKMGDEYPEQWKKLLDNNPKLILSINEFLKVLEVRKHISLEENLRHKIDHGIWDHFNPLLKKAADAMLECGINPGEFFT